MDTRRLLSSTVLYGLADVAVMAVGGFLLLPLYTRTLSQSEFGMYVAVRANIDILTYLLYFGLPSAVARVYFDYRKVHQQAQYLSSIVCFFLIVLGALCVVFAAFGAPLWSLLSPTTPVHPYLALSVAVAATGFFGGLSTLWLRLDARPLPVVGLQLGASAVLAGVAALNLLLFDLGLRGLLVALLASAVLPACALPLLFGRGFRPTIRRAHVVESLRYAMPVLVGYIAYFVLNRLSLLILQRHVPVEQVAVYGLAQQLSMIVAIAGTSFGMALQPAVFGAEATDAIAVLRRAARVMLALMLAVTATLVLFSRELFSLVAPPAYAGGEHIFVLLVVANFTNAFTLVSDTAMLYHRRPTTSVAVSVLSACAATALALWLIPLLHLEGAALSVLGGLAFRMAVSHWLAWRIAGIASVPTMVVSMAAVCVLAAAVGWLERQQLAAASEAGAKLLAAAFALPVAYFLLRKLRPIHA